MNQRAPFVALDDARPGHEHVTLFTQSTGTIRADEPCEIAAAFAAVERGLGQGLHAAGYFSYELGYALELRLLPLLPRTRRVPLLWFGLFRKREEVGGDDANAVLEARVTGRAYAGPPRFDETEESYARGFAAVRNYIEAGDVYQVNLTFRGRFPFVGDPLALYLHLRAHSAAGHGAYVEDGERSCLSLSPELFFDVRQGAITSKPMKGTAPHSADTRVLQASDKDRAENLMIVDLIRNDLGRVATTGSVRVDDLFAVETYPTVHQMVSTVRAHLRSDTTPEKLIRALFPCGSITGAPKIRAMEIIRELERNARGLYCGAIGAFSPDGTAHFNVAIRTITIADGEGELGIGGGVVADSDCAAEFAECHLKARYFTETRRPLSLIETLRYAPDEGFTRLPLHLARMARSAAAFGIPFGDEAAKRALRAAAGSCSGPTRIRLELKEGGALECKAQPLAMPASREVWTYAIAERRVQSGDQLLRHKTSWRELHDSEFEQLSELLGCDEVIFLNERDEITEGGRSNIFLKFGGRLITPALSCGVLDGCLRRALLDDPSARCEEGVLHEADLARADAVYLGNSLRGLVPAVPANVRRLAIA